MSHTIPSSLRTVILAGLLPLASVVPAQAAPEAVRTPSVTSPGSTRDAARVPAVALLSGTLPLPQEADPGSASRSGDATAGIDGLLARCASELGIDLEDSRTRPESEISLDDVAFIHSAR